MNERSRTTEDGAWSWSRPALSLFVYAFVWCGAVFYSIYCAGKTASDLAHFLSEEDFERGWTILGGTKKDISDYEWAFFSSFFVRYAPWTLGHVIVSLCLKRSWPRLLPLFYTAFSLATVIAEVGVAAVCFLLLQVILMYCAQLTRKKWLCWTVSLTFLLIINLETTSGLKDYLVASESHEEYILAVVIAWINCRCLSFCMVRCSGDDKRLDAGKPFSNKWTANGRTDDFLLLLAYCLYFPLLFSGPLVMYDDFVHHLSRTSIDWTISRLISASVMAFRYLFWFLFNEVVLHYFYVSALHYHPPLVEQLPLWPLCGIAFGMSQFFMTKYTVLYGLASTVANVEGFSTPPTPKWFDFGLYTFLKRYIYIPLVGARRSFVSKALGGLACFSFVYIWHGATRNILVWVVFNYVGVTVENLAAAFGRSAFYDRCWLKSSMGLSMERHLRAFVTAPLLIMSAISNFYFICGGELGDIFVRRIVIGGWPNPMIPIWAIFFCMCHLSAEIKSWECHWNRRDMTLSSGL